MVEIKQVLTKTDLRKWVRFPNRLYKDNPYFVPFLESDEIETFSPDKNPAYAFCETKLFLAYRNGKIVGRIAGLINHNYNQKWNKNALRFTRFDFIDDYEVSQALFDSVTDWGKQRGYTEVMGPIGFTDLDHEGMLVEGFDQLNMSITFYNYPYYRVHMERLGLQKDIDWIEYKITVPDALHPRIERMAKHVAKKGNYEVVTYTNRSILKKDALEALCLIDRAYAKLYGTVPLTDEIIKQMVNKYIPLVNLKWICSIKNIKGDIVAFGIMIPSIALAAKKSNGKLLPFGLFRMLKALRCHNDTLEMFLVAVDPALQTQGLPAILIHTLLQKAVENKVKYCETGPMLETNKAIHSLWRVFDKQQHKRRRCYIKNI